MANYVLPQVLVFQEFALVPAAAAQALRAHIAGPQAQLVRFNQPSEQAQGYLGIYDSAVPISYPWPNRAAGGVIDEGYTKLWFKDALLHYFGTAVGGGHMITKVANYANRLHSTNFNFASNGIYPRDATLLDRDVQPGDVAFVRGFDGSGNPVELWTYVRDIHGDPSTAVVAPASADPANQAAQVAAASASQTAGPHNALVVTPNGSAYNGLAAGHVTETYDLLVTQGSVNHDLTKAVLRVISGSGTDDQPALVPPGGLGVPIPVGTRGLKVVIDSDQLAADSLAAAYAGIPTEDLIIGQRWRVTVSQAFTPALATSGGSYTGAQNTTYVVEVVTGGNFGATPPPQVSVSTTNGIDISGPTAVPAAGTAVPAGNFGVTIQFAGTGLNRGDRYYVPVTASAEGAMHVLELGNGLPPAVAAGSEVDLSLYIRKPTLQVSQVRAGMAPLTNWDQADLYLTVNAGITALDPTWTQAGVPQPLPVASAASQNYGALYVEYRAWLSDLAQGVYSISDVGTLDAAVPGALDPDNPLKWGLAQALLNNNGVPVLYTGVADPDSDSSWDAVLGQLTGRRDVYGLVPLTRRPTVQQLYAGHVDSESSPETAAWRVTWFNLEGVPVVPVVSTGSTIPGYLSATTTDGQVCMCTISQDPLAAGTSYTLLTCPAANGGFVTNGVRPGDVVRTNFTVDAYGEPTYGEYVVDSVLHEDQLRLLVGPGSPSSVPLKTEVWRNLSPDEEAAALARQAGAWGDRRVRAVWPDQIESAGVVMDGYHLCATLAGLASGVLPHQGLTRLEISGYAAVPRTTQKFGRAQLDTMAGGGVWIVTQDPIDGSIFTRHAVTTASYDDINQREEMITRNVDSISYRFQDHFAPFIGVANVTQGIIDRINLEAGLLIDILKQESYTPNLGGQLIDGTITDLHQHVTLKDRIVLRIQLTVPYALNNLEIHLMV